MLQRGNMVLKLPNNVQNKQIPILVMSLLFISALYLVLYREDGKKLGSSSGILKQNWDKFRNGTDFIRQIPDSPKTILFLAHGCDAANFWTNHLIITVSSAGKCWSFKEERFIVKDVIEWWIAKQKLQCLPLVALGASSGGYFVSILATDVRFSSIVSYPSTLFVHMPKDKIRMQKLERYMVLMKEKGIDVAEVKCLEFPLSPNLFADRIPSIDVPTSAKLFSLFQKKGFIDKNGFMTNDWQIVLPDKSLVNHIQEEMNLAFALPEMTSLQSEQIFNWFETHLKDL
ncbi:unnamed protein product [Withania somnifera]